MVLLLFACGFIYITALDPLHAGLHDDLMIDDDDDDDQLGWNRYLKKNSGRMLLRFPIKVFLILF